MRSKFESYMGFAAKSRSLVSGAAVCISAMEKGKAKLLIISEGTSEGTIEKLRAVANRKSVPLRIYGQSLDLSHMTGKTERNIFAITDRNFAKVIMEQIDAEKKEVLE